jgi:hypothetical protein
MRVFMMFLYRQNTITTMQLWQLIMGAFKLFYIVIPRLQKDSLSKMAAYYECL